MVVHQAVLLAGFEEPDGCSLATALEERGVAVTRAGAAASDRLPLSGLVVAPPRSRPGTLLGADLGRLREDLLRGLGSTFDLVRAAAPRIARGGVIVFGVPLAAHASTGDGAAAVLGGATLASGRALAVELADSGVRVCTVSARWEQAAEAAPAIVGALGDRHLTAVDVRVDDGWLAS